MAANLIELAEAAEREWIQRQTMARLVCRNGRAALKFDHIVRALSIAGHLKRK